MRNKLNDKKESHPLKPFISPEVRVMMLGSFPPAQSKWTMDFYYPNFQNDMWRIFGLVFFDDKDYFIAEDGKSFNLNLLQTTLIDKRIGVGDTAKEVIRLKNNASDKYLKIVEPLNIPALLDEIPHCRTFITTGDKATETLRLQFSDTIKHPRSGACVSFNYNGQEFKLYRMPSSSRAYPMALKKKAEVYKSCFKDIGLL